MKKILNFRPLFYCFIAFFTAILFAQYVFKTNWVYISIFAVLLFTLLFLSITRKQIKIFLCILLFCSLGFLGYFIEASTYNVEDYGQSVVTGRVSSQKQDSDSALQKIVLDNVTVSGKEIDESIYLFIYGEPFLNIGDDIKFTGKINAASAFYNGNFSSFIYKNNIRYIASTSGTAVEILGSNINLDESVRSAAYEKLQQNMDSDNSALAYAMLFGDSSDVDISTMDDYRGSGILHILSVSGLHVGIIVGFLYWFFKKIRCPKIAYFLIITGILIFYCYLCGFVPTVVRSAIMSICLLGAALIGRKYDALSALGLAGLIILAINPLYAYDISFQLSFGCMIGISMFYAPLTRFFRKIKLPKFIASSLAISISAQFLVLPVLIGAFGGSSIFSIFLNILVIPLFSVAYIVLFLALPLTFLSPFFGNFLWFSNLIMQGISICANFVAGLIWSYIPKYELTFAGMVAIYSAIFIASGYVFASLKTKMAICSSIILTGLIFVLGYKTI